MLCLVLELLLQLLLLLLEERLLLRLLVLVLLEQRLVLLRLRSLLLRLRLVRLLLRCQLLRLVRLLRRQLREVLLVGGGVEPAGCRAHHALPGQRALQRRLPRGGLFAQLLGAPTLARFWRQLLLLLVLTRGQRFGVASEPWIGSASRKCRQTAVKPARRSNAHQESPQCPPPTSSTHRQGDELRDVYEAQLQLVGQLVHPRTAAAGTSGAGAGAGGRRCVGPDSWLMESVGETFAARTKVRAH